MEQFLLVDFWVFTDVTCMHRHTEGDLKGFKCLSEMLLPLLSKSHSHSKKYKNNVVGNILDSNLGALVPHITVLLHLCLHATYILFVVLYSFIPLKNEALHWLINVYARTVKKWSF